jgi:hypothetical protein
MSWVSVKYVSLCYTGKVRVSAIPLPAWYKPCPRIRTVKKIKAREKAFPLLLKDRVKKMWRRGGGLGSSGR